jgi:hypothetical protein
LTPVSGGDNRPLNFQVTRLQLRAYAAKAVVNANSEQGLTVIVLDQYFKPVEQALVAVKLAMPDGSVESFALPATDKNGVSRKDEIKVGNLNANQIVLVEVNVTFGDLRAATTTWFHVWW